MWNNSKFEVRLQQQLQAELGKTDGETVFGHYTGARKILLDDVYNEIRGAEPSLTDHGPDHIRNVLDNVESLIVGADHFSAHELYVLGLGVLFHDVGNLDGREGHNQRITKYYDLARPGDPERWVNEKRLVVAVAQAHTGRNREGGRDTLEDVPTSDHLDGHNRIRLQEIAAVVRFADELAEGLQRTSLFLQSQGLYEKDAQIHHRYASVTHVAIDRGLSRIALTYNIIFDRLGDTDQERADNLGELLNYTYKRIAKLDEERKYAKYYCPDLLLPFQNTSVQINLVVRGEFVDLGLEPLVLSDKVVPEGQSDQLPDIDETYRPDAVIDKVTGHIENLEIEK